MTRNTSRPARPRAAGKAGEGGGHELKDLDRDREANVVSAAVACLAAAAAALAWPHYQQLLGRFMRLMARDASKARAAGAPARHGSMRPTAAAACMHWLLLLQVA